MVAHRPSLLKATAPWFVGAFLTAVAFVALAHSEPLHVRVLLGVVPFLAWAGQAIGAWRTRQALDRFAAEIPSTPEASCSMWNVQTLRWDDHSLTVEGHASGPLVRKLIVRDDTDATRISTSQARQAAQAALRGSLDIDECDETAS